jgi:hypothetical protein
MSELEFYEQLRIAGSWVVYVTAMLFTLWSVWAVIKLWLDSLGQASRRRGDGYHEEFLKQQRDCEMLRYEEQRLDFEKKHGEYIPKDKP